MIPYRVTLVFMKATRPAKQLARTAKSASGSLTHPHRRRNLELTRDQKNVGGHRMTQEKTPRENAPVTAQPDEPLIPNSTSYLSMYTYYMLLLGIYIRPCFHPPSSNYV